MFLIAATFYTYTVTRRTDRRMEDDSKKDGAGTRRQEKEALKLLGRINDILPAAAVNLKNGQWLSEIK